MSEFLTALLPLLALVPAWIGIYRTDAKSALQKHVLFLIAVVLASSAVWSERTAQQRAIVESDSGTLTQPRRSIAQRAGLMQRLQLGDAGTFIHGRNEFAAHQVRVLNEEVFEIKVSGDSLLFSGTIRDMDGAIVCRITENEWQVVTARAYEFNHTANALEVKDTRGDVLLQLLLLSDRVKLQGVFWGKDSLGVAYLNQRDSGAVMMSCSKRDASKLPRIKPMFRYPTRLHFGVFASTDGVPRMEAR